MEQISLTRKVESVADGKVTIRTSSVESHTMEECVKILPQHEANFIKLLQEKEQLEKLVADKFWEKEFERIDLGLGKTEELITMFKGALEPYFEDLKEKGRKFISVEKKRRKYGRMTKGEAKVVAQVAIRNDCRAHIGLDDIAHPVMLALRDEFEKL